MTARGVFGEPGSARDASGRAMGVINMECGAVGTLTATECGRYLLAVDTGDPVADGLALSRLAARMGVTLDVPGGRE